eukprot:1431495-Prymnesium_polylepis.1
MDALSTLAISHTLPPLLEPLPASPKAQIIAKCNPSPAQSAADGEVAAAASMRALTTVGTDLLPVTSPAPPLSLSPVTRLLGRSTRAASRSQQIMGAA